MNVRAGKRAGIALLLSLPSFFGCQTCPRASPSPPYSVVWKSLVGKRVAQVTLWATPSHLASPSLCFELREDGAYRIEAVAEDHVVFSSTGGSWFLPLAIVQLRTSEPIRS